MLRIITFVTVMITSVVYSQPYYYYFKYDSSYHVPGYSGDIYRLNLVTNSSAVFAENVGRVNSEIFTNMDQSEIFFQVRFSLAVIDVNDTTHHSRYVLDGINQLVGTKDSPGTNRYYVTFEDEQDSTKIVAMDHVTVEPIGTIYENYGGYTPFFSGDENYLYQFHSDSTGIFFSKFIINDRRNELPQRCGDIVPVESFVILNDAKNGLALVSYESNTKSDFSGVEYVLCDVDRNMTFAPFNFPWRSNGRLSPDGKYAVTEQVNFDTTHVGGEYRPGNIFVFDAHIGTLLQRLTLPPEGKILLFDNYANMLYYYLPREQRSINIDLSKLANITSLSPAFAYAGSNAFIVTVNGKNFANGSIVNWGSVAKTTTFVADSILQASVLAADIAVIDSALITVKNADGTAESNGIRFYIKQPPPITGCNVKLINSSGTKLIGGALQYYEGGWKDAVNNNDGTFFVSTTARTVSLRMTYEYGSQTKSNVAVGPDTVVFQTVNAQIQLQDSRGGLIDTGTVQYYGGAWRSLGTTAGGIAQKELLPGNYSFRMTYAYASKDKQQDIGTNPTVVFQTVNASVQLQNSQGGLIDQGTVQYYAGAWRGFGVTTSGVASKELLPNNYSFRMTYALASKDKQQDIGANPTVVFQTVNTTVQLQNSQGTLIDQGTAQYYSGAWRDFGTTTNGIANKELLPNNYSFRMTYAYASRDKQQDIGTNPTVVFQTVNALVQLQNSQGSLMPAPSGDQGTVQYYAGAWRGFGTTTGGVANKELLPNNYSFRMTYEYVSLDKTQDLSTNSTVSFSTVLCTIRVKNSQSQPLDGATASYYSGAWRQIGTTVNGEVTKELLPVNLTFRVNYGTQQQDKTQNLSTSTVVEFTVGP
jgi:hypothetical protein